MRKERGFAVLLVLWTVALFSFLVIQMSVAGRTEVRVAANLGDAAAAEAAADGAVQQALLRLLQGTFAADGTARTAMVGGIPVAVWARNEASKVNPNLASAETLQALLLRAGADRTLAATLTAAIVDWRTPNRRPDAERVKSLPYAAAGLRYAPPGRWFEGNDELGLVIGMPPALLARLLPSLSVYTERGEAVDPDDPTSRNGLQYGSNGAVMVVDILAAAETRNGARFTRHIIAKLRPGAGLEQLPYTILTWDRDHG